jgi:hypothetical protein
MIELVSDLVKALNKYTPTGKASIHKSVQNLMDKTSYVWKSDYLIAVAKDDSKEKIANLMVSTSLNLSEPTFQVKREHDFWKKLDERDDYKAVVEFSSIAPDTSMAVIEKLGRDIMRSRKEVPTVGKLGFVWVVRVNPIDNLDAIFQLYFKEDHITLSQDEAKYYIGWSEKLKEMDMRHFVCDPALIY